MSVLSLQAVGKRFGDRRVFHDVSLRVGHGERAALVGPNGCGKTTLLRIAAGRDEPDDGSVALARGTRVGYLEQELLVDVPGTVEEHARAAAAHLRDLERAMRALEPELARGGEAPLQRYADVQHRFEHAGGYEFDARVSRVLSGLGLDALAGRAVRTLSGGERTRLGLARLLLDDPDLLLLDEPTNHLDIAALEWLERFLIEQELTLLVSSHDRWTLDRVTSRTFSFEGGTVVAYRGGYSRYLRQRAEREAANIRAADRQAGEIARTEEFIRRYGAGQRAKEARGRAKKLARVERIAAPARGPGHTWRLEATHLAGDIVIDATPLAVGFDRKRPILRTPALQVRRGARVAVVGPNGAGKTTLVRTITGELPALDGYVSAASTARVALLAQAQSDLMDDRTVLEALREAGPLDEQEARTLLARFLVPGEDVFRAVGVLSGGERARLALARLAVRHANLLVLDEPTNHLDVAAREALEGVLDGYDGTILLVSHDRYFIDRLATEVWLIEGGALRRHEGNWTSLQRRLAAERAPFTRPGGARTVAERPLSAAPQRARQEGRAGGAARSGPARRRSGPDPASRSSAARVREMEARIAALEEQLHALEARVAEIARSGDYLETRRAGEAHAELERSLRELYEQWAALAGEREP
ncbi:MAG TPA: ABC-F family ATP-binding cassette domain-containing protein [Candidatus Limnocylindrales bacterium]|nr:ABC-F family ATP-binding cassette domain-containing protein [Candidatus Limnocylindrales bacterium]